MIEISITQALGLIFQTYPKPQTQSIHSINLIIIQYL